MVVKQDQIAKVLSSLSEVVVCQLCGTRIRFGDVECPHCGSDIDHDLHEWAERLIDRLAI